LLGGGRVNLNHAAEIVIHDFRSGALGRVTLETPEEFTQWLEVGEKLDAERQIKKDAIELARNIRLKKVPRPPKHGSRGAAEVEDDEPSD
jgi:ribosome biogenesis GTPase A